MDAGINNVIYKELYSGPKMTNGTCGKTIVTGTIDRGSTVYRQLVFISNSLCEADEGRHECCRDNKTEKKKHE
jgi:hypothetical protein